MARTRLICPFEVAMIRGNRAYLTMVHAAVEAALTNGCAAFKHEDNDGDEGTTTITCDRERRPIGFKRKRARSRS